VTSFILLKKMGNARISYAVLIVSQRDKAYLPFGQLMLRLAEQQTRKSSNAWIVL
jgi:hypothetical protein